MASRLSPEHRDAASAKFARWADLLGAAINVFMLTLQLSLIPSHDTGTVVGTALPSYLVLRLVLFTLGSCVWLPLSYRLPRRSE